MKKISINDQVKIKINEKLYIKGKVSKIEYDLGRFIISVKYDEKMKAIKVDARDITKE